VPMSDYVAQLRKKIGHTLLEIPTVSVTVFDEQNRILLVKHVEGNRWTTPGGMVEPGELPSTAAVREVWEETGLFVELVRVLGIYGGPDFKFFYSNGDVVSVVMTSFAARIRSGEMKPDGVETLDIQWFSEEEAASVELQPWLGKVIHNFYQRPNEVVFQQTCWNPENRS